MTDHYGPLDRLPGGEIRSSCSSSISQKLIAPLA
jgi:hypothetical protein